MSGLRHIARQLWVQVLLGLLVGGALGVYAPGFAVALKPLADGFIKLIKMLLAPIVFGTVAVGIARMGSLKEVGRIGVKALLYFEVLSTVALALGLGAANLFKPGAGMTIVPSGADTAALTAAAGPAHVQAAADFFLGLIPDTWLGAFTGGAMLPVILVAILTGVALSRLRDRAAAVTGLIDQATRVVFDIVGLVMTLAPLGAGAGLAFTIGKYGLSTLWSLGYLVAVLYGTTLVFVFGALGLVARLAGIDFLRFLRFIGDEILVVLGTCSTEAVMPRLMQKLERLGCRPAVVGLVLPAGYTFNADGTCLYLTLAVLFVAQATHVPLSLGQQLLMLGTLTLTSKGSAGVAGAGFVTLAATVALFPVIPAYGLVLLLGIDRFLNEARAVTNLIGNAVATLAVSRWDGALDLSAARATLSPKPMGESA